MPKYKYVDGVKYRVVPQSVLGYALVKEGSDNSLPSGGTEGQVLSKASDADYDVEWATVEGGGGDVFLIDAVVAQDESVTVSKTESEILEAIASGKSVYIDISYGENTTENYVHIYLPLVYVNVDSVYGTTLKFMSFDEFYPGEHNTYFNFHGFYIFYGTNDGWLYSEPAGELQSFLS